MSRLLDFLKTNPPPGKRSVAELEAAVNAARATLEPLEANVALHALNAADGVPEAEVRLQVAQDALEDANKRIRALNAALSAACKREEADVATKRFDTQSLQAANVKKLLQRREKAAADLSSAIGAAVDAWRKLLDLSERSAIAFPGGNPTEAMMKYGLGNVQVEAFVKAEIFRLGGNSYQGGSAGAAYPPSFPGGHAPAIGISPAKVTPLAQVIAAADDAAVQAMEHLLATIKPSTIEG